ncbi:hypothetical protein [Corynebacterium freiburgense]|uniref:hypothetical protein n=1 Tax=Corynebacterium freiburgense TaxID=556548 RepID=UPI00040D6064|nr:hypothetical protein [Corynebacterium freiburgense]WJZ02652.1 topology modulation protein [Corynebacterium freiburgense]
MKRVVILGRGGAGKSTLARALAARLNIATINLDSLFWKADLSPTPAKEWREIQQQLIANEHWIIDGDLGPYDSDLALRINAADTIIVLDYPLGICTWRTLRRGKENLDYWRWVISYRFRYLPKIKRTIHQYGNGAKVHYVHSPWGIPDLINATAALPH